MEHLEGEGIRQVFGVLIVFALLALAVWKLRSGPLQIARGGSRAGRLESVGRLGLTPQHALHLVRVDGREVLVATHPQGCVMLADSPAAVRRAGADA